MKKLFLILVIGLLLFSCKKERTIHITAKNAATGAPYPGLTYYVVEQKSIKGGTKSKTVATGTLDANGEAYFTKRLSKEWGHGILVEEPENTCYNKNIQLYFGGETNFEAPFEFAECAYLKLSIHNVDCQGANDKIEFRRLWLSNDGHNDYVKKEGCFDFDGDYFDLPMGEYKYEWIVTKNNIVNNHDTVFQLASDQYFEFNINY